MTVVETDLRPEEMRDILKDLGVIISFSIRVTDDMDTFLVCVSCDNLEVKDDGILSSRYGTGSTPAAAMIALWSKITDLNKGGLLCRDSVDPGDLSLL